MSDGDFTWHLPGPPPVPFEELARQQGAQPVRSFDDMRADVWDTDEELDAFLADVRVSRQHDVA